MRRHEAAVPAHIAFVEGGAAVESDGRQLAAVADDDQLVVDAAADETDQVVEEVAGAEQAAGGGGFDTDQRGFIYDEEGVLRLVEVQIEFTHAVADVLLAVDVLVDGPGLLAGETGEHLGRTAGRGQQHVAVLQFLERLDEGGDGRSLAGTGVAAHQQQVALVILHGEIRERVEKPLLAGRGRIGQMLPELVGEELCDPHQARLR